MKKWMLVLLLVVATGLLVVPGLISAWLPGQLRQSLEESWPDAMPVIQRGWFSTSLTARSPTEQLDLTFQHVPWWQGAWLTGTGELRLTEPAGVIALDGRLGGLGLLEIQASSTGMRWTSQAPNQIGNLEIQLSGLRGQGLNLSANATTMVFSDPLGNQLKLQDVHIDSDWRWIDEATRGWHVTIDSQRPNQPASRLSMQWSTIDAAAAASLMESLGEMNRAAPDSLQAQMAGLGLLSAWQQLVQSGLTLEPSTLNLDQQFQLEGQWQPKVRNLNLQGGGPIVIALDWLTPILGLNQQIRPNQAREQAWSMMAAGEEQGLLRIADEQLEWIATETRTP